MKRKRLFSFLMAMVMILSMGAMGLGAEEDEVEAPPAEPGKIRFTICGATLEDGINPTTKRQAEGWNTYVTTVFAENVPDVELEIISIPWDNARGKLQTLLMSDGTDLFTSGGAYVPSYYKEGLVQPIDDLLDADEEFVYEDNFPAAWRTHRNSTDFSGEHLLTLPWDMGNRIIIYDKQIFEDWGVEPLSEHPTPEEILEKAAQMTGENPVTGMHNYGLYVPANSLNQSYLIPLSEYYGKQEAEGDFGDPKSLTWNFDTPEFIQAVQWLEDAMAFVPEAAVNGQGNEYWGTVDNDIAIYIDTNGVGIMNEVRNTDDESLIDRYVPTLHFSPSGGGWTPIDGVAMSSKLEGDQRDLAWKAMKFIVGAETKTWDYNQFGPKPVTHLVGDDLYSDNDVYLKMNADVASRATAPGYEINPFFVSNMQPAIAGIMSRAVNGEDVDVEAVMQDLQAKAEAWSATQ